MDKEQWKGVMFGIGLLVFGLFAVLMPLSPALQSISSNKYIEALQVSGIIAIPASFILFYLAYKNKIP